MKKSVLLVTLIFSTVILSGCNFSWVGGNNDKNKDNKPEPTPFQRDYDLDQKSDDGSYKIDLSKDETKKVGFEVRGTDNKINKGTIEIKGGSAVVEDGVLKSASIVLDMGTLKTEKGNGSIESAIKGGSYFDIANNSELNLKIVPGDKIPPSPNDLLNYEATGELVVRGQTKEVKFDSSIIETSENVITVSADVDVDMSDFGVSNNDTLKSKFVLNINLVFVKE